MSLIACRLGGLGHEQCLGCRLRRPIWPPPTARGWTFHPWHIIPRDGCPGCFPWRSETVGRDDLLAEPVPVETGEER